MPTRILTAADHTTRVKIESNMPALIQVEIGLITEIWPDGAYIEIVNGCDTASISLIDSAGATVNYLTNGNNTLVPGEYARVSYLGANVWDCHVYNLPGAAPPPSGGVAMNVYTAVSATGTFGGSLVNSWNAVVRQDSNVNQWTYDAYTGTFTCIDAGLYDVVVDCKIEGNVGAPSYAWPDELSSYGIDLEPSGASLNSSQSRPHTRYSPPGSHPNLNGNFGLIVGASSTPASSAGSVSTFTERFSVTALNGGQVTPRMFAHSYNASSAEAIFSLVISFMKVSPLGGG